MEDEDEDGESENDGDKTNLSNPSTSKKSTGASYLIFEGGKKVGGNTKKDFKAAKSFNYLILGAKKVFNFLQHAFT